jgi:hypothetical protein
MKPLERAAHLLAPVRFRYSFAPTSGQGVRTNVRSEDRKVIAEFPPTQAGRRLGLETTALLNQAARLEHETSQDLAA